MAELNEVIKLNSNYKALKLKHTHTHIQLYIFSAFQVAHQFNDDLLGMEIDLTPTQHISVTFRIIPKSQLTLTSCGTRGKGLSNQSMSRFAVAS